MSAYSKGRPSRYTPATEKGKIPPKEPGEYRILDYHGTIVYIGETCNLYRRMREHIHSGKIKMGKYPYSFEYKQAQKGATPTMRREHEKKKIKKHKPRLNKSGGGEGRKGLRHLFLAG